MKERKTIRIFIRRQIPTVAVLLLAAIGIALLPTQVPLSKAAQASQLGPRFVPMVMLWGTIGFCLLSILTQAYACLIKKEPLKPFPVTTLRQYSKVLCLVAALILWYVLLRPVGFIIMTALLMAVSMLLLGNRRTWQLIAIPVICSAVIYVIFAHMLNVPLPAGILPL